MEEWGFDCKIPLVGSTKEVITVLLRVAIYENFNHPAAVVGSHRSRFTLRNSGSRGTAPGNSHLESSWATGFQFRTQIKDKDVDKVRAKGGRVLVLDTHYTRDDLEKAKKQCHEPQEK